MTDDEESFPSGVPMTQDAVEWDESQDVDLRILAARSHDLFATPSTRRIPTDGSASRKQLSSTSDKNQAKNKNYSPGREVEGIANTLLKYTTVRCVSDPILDAPTQPNTNLIRSNTYPPPSSAAISNMRHRRKRRVEYGLRQDRKRLPQVKDGKSDYIANMDTPRIPSEGTSSIIDHSLGFDDLLKQLEQPEARRIKSATILKSGILHEGYPEQNTVGYAAESLVGCVNKENLVDPPMNQHTKHQSTSPKDLPTITRNVSRCVGAPPVALIEPKQTHPINENGPGYPIVCAVHPATTCHNPQQEQGPVETATVTLSREPIPIIRDLKSIVQSQVSPLYPPNIVNSNTVLTREDAKPLLHNKNTNHIEIKQTKFERENPTPIHAPVSKQLVFHQAQTVPSSTTHGPSSSQFDDDLEFSADELAALDAVMLEAIRTRETLANSVNIGPNSIREQPVQMSLASPNHVDDPFGDPNDDDIFSQMDFDALDKKIQQRKSLDFNEMKRRPTLAVPTPRTKFLAPPPILAPVRNQESVDFDPSTQFLSFSRYQVLMVVDDGMSYTKTVIVKLWCSDMLHDLCDTSIHRFSTSYAPRKKDFRLEDGNGSIFLRGEWYYTQLDAGDIVHLCSLSGKYETNPSALPVVLDTAARSTPNDDLILVVHPDLLVIPTLISDNVSCSRRAILKSRLGSSGLTSEAALFGTMRHELFERSMRSKDVSDQAADAHVHIIAREFAESLVALKITDADARKAVMRVVPQLRHFANNYMTFETPLTHKSPLRKGAILEGNCINPDLHFLGCEVHATEESLLSPEIGLKGNIDCTIKAVTHEAGRNVPGTFLYSIELKTGHSQTTQNAHTAQLALYTLMLKIRYGSGSGNAADSGMLLYLNNDGCRPVRVKPEINELRSLIGQRNAVATQMKRSSRPRGIVLNIKDDSKEACFNVDLLPAPPTELPSDLPNVHTCTSCYINRECMMYFAANLNSAPESEAISSSSKAQKSHGQLLHHYTGHLDADDLNYFTDWDRLIDIEADATTHLITTSWLKPSFEGEVESGTSVTSLVLDLNVRRDPTTTTKPSLTVTARRSKDSLLETHFTNLNIEPGNHVIISTDTTSIDEHEREVSLNGQRSRRRQMQIARGFLNSVEEGRLVIRFSVQEYNQIVLYVRNLRTHESMEDIKFRLDKDIVSTGIGTLRQNLVRLFTTDIAPFGRKEIDPRLAQGPGVRNRFSWLRDVVVRLRSPLFGDHSTQAMFVRPTGNFPSLPGCGFEDLKSEFYALNVDQQSAVEKAFNTKDYLLIQGMPGTGKTSVTAFIARLLAAHGKRVLITSYTHAAVDNLMIKLIDKDLTYTDTRNPIPRLARIASKDACHPAVHSVLVPEIAMSREGHGTGLTRLPSSDSLHAVISSARIVGVTALTIPRSPLLVGQNFDVVIVDEAGQISQPAILGALVAADSFVLVGDHLQLPPLVISEIAEKGGLGISMLRRLAEKHPTTVSQLTIQYRMHEQICNLCNEIVYEGKLRCATDKVKNQRLALHAFPSAIPIPDRWLTNVINPSRPVVFIDTDPKANTMGGVPVSPIFGLERSLGRQGMGSTVNDTEAEVVGRIVNSLLACGALASSIGIISPFRAQLRVFDDIPEMEKWKKSGLEVSTIDRYQGRDKDIIIISFVRSNPKGKAGRLLEDARRLNVAFSRAKCKLILIGSVSTLHRGSEVLRAVLDGLRNRSQVQHLAENCLKSTMQNKTVSLNGTGVVLS